MTYKCIKLVLFTSLIIICGCKNDNINSCSDAKSAFTNWVKKTRNRADTLLLEGKLDRLIADHPGCAYLFIERGNLAFSLNDLDRSKNYFLKAFFLDTSAIYPLYQLAIVYQLESRYDSSIYFLSKALLKKTYGNAVIDFHKLEGVDESSSIGRYDVDYKEIVYQLAVSNYYAHSLNVALSYFNLCLSNNYMIGKSHLYRGSIYLELNKKMEACEDFIAAKMQGTEYAQMYLDRYCNDAPK